MRIIALIFIFLMTASLAVAAPVWHVKGESELYLFGTVHVMSENQYPLPSIIPTSFAKCDRLWLEIDRIELQDPTVISEIRKLMLLPAGETIFDHLPAESISLLQQLAAESGLSLTLFQGLKPWAAVNVLTVTIMQMRGYEAEYGLDLYFENQARKQGIPIRSLETTLWQMGMLSELGERFTESFIEFSTNNMDDIDQLVSDMMRFWRNGDVDSLYQQADFTDYPEIEQTLLTSRNHSWVSSLVGANSNGVDCVAVGALHMAGPNSLLKLFENRGYQVTQLH